MSLLSPFDRLQISGVEIRLRQIGKELNIAKVHPHKFRRTLATMAIDKGMPIEQVQHLLGHQSMDILMREQLEINEARNQTLIGKTLTVLCEDYDPVGAIHFGRGVQDAPEIDGKIYFRSDVRIAPGSFVQVKIREVMDYDLIGRAVIEK